MRTSLLALMCALGLLISPVCAAYDAVKAQQYQELFAPFADANVPKALARIPVEKLLESLQAGEDMMLVDVRTVAENAVVGLTYKNSVLMPMDEIFKPANLARLPTDKKVVIVCHKGLRAELIAISLRDIGFKNVFALKGGMLELLQFIDPKTAHPQVSGK